MKAFKVLTAAVICTAVLSACAKPSSNDLIPLLNLAWFTSYDDVKNNMGNYTLLEEREAENEKLKQFMQDYANVDLFGVNCDLTLCFTDSGLIGLIIMIYSIIKIIQIGTVYSKQTTVCLQKRAAEWHHGMTIRWERIQRFIYLI